MGIRIIRHEVGGNGMKVEGAEERVIGGVLIGPFHGMMLLGLMPMPFTTILTCTSLIPRPTRARQIQQ